jgi:hypothetical protein
LSKSQVSRHKSIKVTVQVQKRLQCLPLNRGVTGILRAEDELELNLRIRVHLTQQLKSVHPGRSSATWVAASSKLCAAPIAPGRTSPLARVMRPTHCAPRLDRVPAKA